MPAATDLVSGRTACVPDLLTHRAVRCARSQLRRPPSPSSQAPLGNSDLMVPKLCLGTMTCECSFEVWLPAWVLQSIVRGFVVAVPGWLQSPSAIGPCKAPQSQVVV